MELVRKFEREIADFYGAPFAVATDSCTHAIELCLRHRPPAPGIELTIPSRTYISVPFTLMKLDLNWHFVDQVWQDYYYIDGTNIVDAAVFFKEQGYINGTYMCLSFQFQKHLSLGRGGMILTDNREAMWELKKMSYDGREPDIPWREQNIKTKGYHYYMAPETAMLGLKKLPEAINTKPREWVLNDWPDLTQMEVFKND